MMLNVRSKLTRLITGTQLKMWGELHEDVVRQEAAKDGSAGTYHDDTGIGPEVEVALEHEDSSSEV